MKQDGQKKYPAPVPGRDAAEPQPAPTLISDESIQDFYQFTPDSFKLAGYAPLDFIYKIPVAV